ncbi:hypothetical protein OUZ56_017308 [Daphnia magna]|uniref:Uncharacterized protein n=1 Tax=Daphnia magna TaxID=35525 RepID=A0ABR0ASN9_9CRUS|nr:hypothetical protein OUZ56_017308 [Daphnia magna]
MADDRFETHSQEKEVDILIGVFKSSYAAGCLDSEANLTNPSENMEEMEAGKESKESSTPQPRSTEDNSSQEFNHTS